MDITDFTRFRLIDNSKAPTTDYCHNNRNDTWRKGTFKCNTGIPTGSINNITVIDLDFHKFDNPNDNKFDDHFDNKDNKYLFETCNTFTVKTASGGYHLYFKYDPELRTTQNDLHYIDIRNDKGYVVSPDSIVDSKRYKIINDVPINVCPKELKDYLLEFICPPKIIQNKKIKKVIDNNVRHALTYKYNITKHEIKQLIYELPNKYWSNKDYGFLKFTSFCKYFNIQQLWDEINKTKPNYNYSNNINKYWNTTCYNEGIIDEILSLGTNKKNKDNKTIYDNDKYINYYKYKPVLQNKIIPDVILDNKKKLGYEYFKSNKNYVVKSDTGTGKTTSFKYYVKNYNLKFISIVSRVSLALEQYNTFNNFDGLNVVIYKLNQTNNELYNGDNVIITIDSIERLFKFNFKDYVIFLDEFNSLLKYLITNNNHHSQINKNRTMIYLLFRRIIMNCKQVICCDADITDIALRWIKHIKPVEYVKNTYKHNNNVLAYEIKDFDELINKLKTEDTFMLCMDSKKQANIVYRELDDQEILLIMGGDNKYYNLDDYKKVIFTPKIVYGVDSSMKRNVYCYYTEKTIMPTGMIQQIARCRNIDKLFYLFSKKKYTFSSNTYQDIKQDVYMNNLLGCRYFEMGINESKVYKEYQELLVSYVYNDDCYKTNKFAHFRKLLMDRGMKLELHVKHNKFKSDRLKELTKAEKQKLIDEFDIKNYQHIQKLLKIPTDSINKYIEYYIDDNLRNKHFNLCRYIYKFDEMKYELEHHNNDFIHNKIKTTYNKMIFLNKIKDTKFNVIEHNKDITDKQWVSYYEEYKQLFRDRSKLNISNDYDKQKIIVKIYKQLFGKDIIISKSLKHPKDKDGIRKKYTQYLINYPLYDDHVRLYNIRKHKQTTKLIT